MAESDVFAIEVCMVEKNTKLKLARSGAKDKNNEPTLPTKSMFLDNFSRSGDGYFLQAWESAHKLDVYITTERSPAGELHEAAPVVVEDGKTTRVGLVAANKFGFFCIYVHQYPDGLYAKAMPYIAGYTSQETLNSLNKIALLENVKHLKQESFCRQMELVNENFDFVDEDTDFLEQMEWGCDAIPGEYLWYNVYPFDLNLDFSTPRTNKNIRMGEEEKNIRIRKLDERRIKLMEMLLKTESELSFLTGY